MPRSTRTATAVLVASAISGAACSQPVSQHASAPASSQYEIVFPSTAAAIATDQVEILVFDTSMPDTDCLSLLTTRQAGAPLPEAPTLVFDSQAIDTCSLTTGSGTLDVSFGERSFLVIAQRGGSDLFTGCAQTDLEADSATIVVPIAQAGTATALPDTACTSLSQKCAGGC